MLKHLLRRETRQLQRDPRSPIQITHVFNSYDGIFTMLHQVVLYLCRGQLALQYSSGELLHQLVHLNFLVLAFKVKQKSTEKLFRLVLRGV